MDGVDQGAEESQKPGKQPTLTKTPEKPVRECPFPHFQEGEPGSQLCSQLWTVRGKKERHVHSDVLYKLNKSIITVIMCVVGGTRHGDYKVVTRQLCGVSSLLPPSNDVEGLDSDLYSKRPES